MFIGQGSKITSSARSPFITGSAVVAMAAIVTLSTLPVSAALTYDGAGTTPPGTAYLTPADWVGDVLPTSADDVVFDNSATTLTGQTVTIAGTAAANSWTLGSGTGAPLGAFTINAASSTGRAVTLGNGAITVDSSVTGAQNIATANGALTFTSSTGTLTVTNNSTQTLTMQNVAYSAGTNLTFASSGGAITSGVVAFPTVASLNGGYSAVTVDRPGTGSARTLAIAGGTGSHMFAGTIAGGSANGGISVTVNGDSTFVQALTGNNTYAGTTTVATGTLLVNGSIQEANSVTVNGGGIGGSGSIFRTAAVNRAFTLAAGAKLTPGSASGSVGTFSVNWSAASGSTVDLSAASNNTGAYIFDLATPGASDKFAVTTGTNGFNTGTLDFSDFTFNALAGFGPGTYILFDGNSNAGATLDQHSLSASSLIGNASGTIVGYDATLSIDTANDDVVLTVVPEPTALATTLGLGGLSLMRRRRAR